MTGQSPGRWRWVIGGVAAVLAVVWVTYVVAVASLRCTAPISGEMAGIPERIDSPWDWIPSVAQQSIGPAGLIIGGSVGALRTPATDRAPWIAGKELGTAAFLAGAGEAYGLLTFESFGMQIPGEQLLLSPDGRQAAYTDYMSGSVVLVDVTTGRVRSVLTDSDMEENYPLAWSPDGSSLIVGKRHRNALSDIAEWYHELFLVDLASGKMVPLLTGEFPVEQLALGFVAAFAPDGSRVAVQMDEEIAIIGTDGRRQATFPASRGGRLAGKTSASATRSESRPAASGYAPLRSSRSVPTARRRPCCAHPTRSFQSTSRTKRSAPARHGRPWKRRYGQPRPAGRLSRHSCSPFLSPRR